MHLSHAIATVYCYCCYCYYYCYGIANDHQVLYFRYPVDNSLTVLFVLIIILIMIILLLHRIMFRLLMRYLTHLRRVGWVSRASGRCV